MHLIGQLQRETESQKDTRSLTATGKRLLWGFYEGDYYLEKRRSIVVLIKIPIGVTGQCGMNIFCFCCDK